MAARLSAPTRSHNRLLESNQSDDRRAAVTASLVGCNVLLDGRSNQPSRVGLSIAAASDESPPRAARSRQRRVIPTRSIGAPSVTAPSRSQRLDPPGCRALPPPTHPGLSFGARPHRCRRRQRAAVGTRPEAPRRAATCSRDPNGRRNNGASWLPRSCARSAIALLASTSPRSALEHQPAQVQTLRPVRGVRLTSCRSAASGAPRRCASAHYASAARRLQRHVRRPLTSTIGCSRQRPARTHSRMAQSQARRWRPVPLDS